MPQLILITSAIFGLLGVALGAFGAHGLKKILSSDMLTIWHTAVEYQFYHTFAIALTGVLMLLLPQATLLRFSALAFIIGTVIFSGSLYTLALTNIRWLGAITPIGGVALIIGWFLLAYSLWKTSF